MSNPVTKRRAARKLNAPRGPTAREFLSVMRKLHAVNPDGYRAVVAEMQRMAAANARARGGVA